MNPGSISTLNHLKSEKTSELRNFKRFLSILAPFMDDGEGFEPPTSWFKANGSAD